MSKKKHFIIIDSNAVIHRAFHALPPLTDKNGELVNAVYGFLLVFFKAVKEFQPDFIAAAFDSRGPTFRHEKFKEYKAKRPPAPEGLYQQIPKIKKILQAFGIVVFEKQGFEADDIIGTIAAAAEQVAPKVESIILSGDADVLQLVSARTKAFLLRKGVKDTVLYDEKMVKEKFHGLTPKQILDYKALKGDQSDNIPGVTGVGEKTAISLILRFKNVKNIYKEMESGSKQAELLSPKLRETLLRYKGQAFLSRGLAEIDKHVPIDFNLAKCAFKGYNKETIVEIFNQYQFRSLIGRLPDSQKAHDHPDTDDDKSTRQKTLFY